MDKKRFDSAVTAGIISQQQASDLLTYFTENSLIENSEEPLRFIRSFGDIFITLGIVFVSVAAANANIQGYWQLMPLLLVILTTEWLVRIRRLALPGMALLISGLYFVSQFLDLSDNRAGGLNSLWLMAFCGLFYLRYKMPFTLLPMALTIIAFVIFSLGIDLRDGQYFLMGFGLVVFVVAMWFDGQDVQRLTYLSDSAFWLHLLAAPLMVHGAMVLLLNGSGLDGFREILIMLFFSSFFLIALFVDRRAMLVSSLSYAIYAVIQLADSLFNDKDLMLFTFIFFGVFIVVLGAYWYKVRSLLFSGIKTLAISRYVPRFD